MGNDDGKDGRLRGRDGDGGGWRGASVHITSNKTEGLTSHCPTAGNCGRISS